MTFNVVLITCLSKLSLARDLDCSSYNVLEKWQELGDSNPRPSVLETDALPTELNSCTPRCREE